jgi:hypothetical protein
MGAISSMAEERKQIIVRLPVETHEWLKANVKGTINDWIVDAINQKISITEPAGAEQEEEVFEDNPLFVELGEIRKSLLEDNAEYTGEFKSLEDELISAQPGGYRIENFKKNYLRKMPEYIKDAMWLRYFDRLEKVEYEDKRAYGDFLRRQETCILCGGDNPDQIVYKDFTASDIMLKFQKGKTYSVREVAEKLQIDYQTAYRNIVPYLTNHGITVKAKKT